MRFHVEQPRFLAGIAMALLASIEVHAQPAAIPEPERYYAHVLQYEVFGIFWVVAEVFILATIRSTQAEFNAFRALTAPRSQRPPWTAAVVAAIVLTACVGARHLIEPDPGDLASAQYRRFIVWSQGVWLAFVVVWVVLETLIVCAGIRLYNTIRDTLPVPSKASPPSALFLAPILAVIGFLLASKQAAAITGVENAFATAFQDTENLRQFVYMMLRAAGIAWVLVEWVAAIYLMKGFYLLRATLHEPQESTP